MSIVLLPSPAMDVHPIPAGDPDAEFAGRWAVWQTRGRTHEREVRRRVLTTAVVVGAMAAAAFIASSLLGS